MDLSNKTWIELVREPIQSDALLARAHRPECGAVLLFLGTTRQWTGTQQTLCLDYEAYEPMAIAEMKSLTDQALQRWPLGFVGIIHRLGRVDIGQASVAIAVSAPHRKAAYDASEWLIDSLKTSIPIWKKDHAATGSSEWLHPVNDSALQDSTRKS